MSDVLVNLKPVACTHSGCGTVFGILADFEAARRADHQRFHCPNGHTLVFSQRTEAERLAKRLEYSRQEADYQRERAEAAERSARALRGWATRRARRAELSEPTDRNDA